MARDTRYKNVRDMILDGRIKAFREMFDREVIPKSVIARDMGMNNTRFTRLIMNVNEFTYGETFMIAGFLEIDEMTVAKIITEQYLLDKQKIKKLKT